MKKISGGNGKEIEISDEFADEVDLDSMLDDEEEKSSFKQNEQNIKNVTAASVSEEIIATVTVRAYFPQNETMGVRVFPAVVKSYSYSEKNNLTKFDLLILKSEFFFLLPLGPKMCLDELSFYSNVNEKILVVKNKVTNDVQFEFLGKQVRCIISLSDN